MSRFHLVSRVRAFLVAFVVFALAGCGGGGGGGDSGSSSTPSTTSTLSSIATYSGSSGSTPSFIITSSDGSTLEFFTQGGATAMNGFGGRRSPLLDFLVRPAYAQQLAGPVITQVLYTDKKKGYKLRGQFDASQRISLLVNENSGEFVSIQYKPNRVDYLLFDATATFKEGYAVLVDNGAVQVGNITGKPTFSGAISMTLSGTTSRSGTLIADDTAGLSNVRTLSGNLANFLASNYLNPTPPKTSVLDFFIRSAFAQSPLNVETIGGAFLTMCGAVVLASTATVGVAVSSPMLVALGGVGLIVAGAHFVKKGLNRNNQEIWDQGIVPGIRNLFDDMLGRFSSGSNSDDVVAAEGNQISSTGAVKATIAQLTSRVGDAARDAVSSIRSNLPSVPTLPDVTTALQGFFADQNGNVSTASGSVATNGSLTAAVGSGSSGYNISGTLNSGTGNVSGSFSGSTVGGGTVTGSVQTFGVCQTQQASGGRGSFVKAYDMGQPNGKVTLTYDMFGIPDALQVLNAGKVVFTTGGLVSGSANTSFTLSGSSIVFVTVTAPNTGTAWNYRLGCAA